MRWIGVLGVLVVLASLPTSVEAQAFEDDGGDREEASEESSEGEERGTAFEEDAAQDSEGEAPAQPWSPGARYASEAGFGTVFGLSGAFMGWLASRPAIDTSGSGFFAQVTDGVTAGAIFGWALLPLGVYQGGTIAGAEGNLLYTYLGSSVGVAASVLAVTTAPDDASWPGVVMLVAPLAGAMAGYESGLQRPAERTADSNRMQLVPTVAAQPDGSGGFFGLSGRF